ncbi:hypothetical protein KO507_11610 [Gilvimarinus agarilyticus]|uniref:ORC-CDC6 family AAA ATPase n=1 Tax=Gilvimarinus sp. 2_MG-2023 TaxID=3062666 RepID=UPI001C09B32A|nr:hypothetical protein [Gilvimarinus sp. 2_MG-2023]MBU2886410.1 hypothetical protein [Gilvimarinus agarilyticus]MDO6571091.1 hypothetical protein [Gilvimarinus sp. 2_MG-2023]
MAQDEQTQLRKLFGENRAEWPPESFQDLFVVPTYFNKLESLKPSMLVGGRGTGKTTSLQSLGYEEALERLESQGLTFEDQQYLGILVRMNKNRVHAFKGQRVSEDGWSKAFSHYFNLIVCHEIAIMAEWLQGKCGIAIPSNEILRISLDLGMSEVSTLTQLIRQIKISISKLQLYVNNPSESTEVIFSMPESPLRTFVELLKESGLLGDRVVFCCIDEYENLLDYQQGIVNTFIKHAVPPLSYKIGVRKFGVRNWKTIDKNDLLSNSDDFTEIHIIDEGFDYFATAVANSRIAFAEKSGISIAPSLKEFLVDLSFSEEARKLGAEKATQRIISEIKKTSETLAKALEERPIEEVYFLDYWREKTKKELTTIAESYLENSKEWKQRLGNHGYASLFWLSKGQKGLRIKKYYSGANAFLALAGGNIRYFLQLLDLSIFHEYDRNKSGVTYPLTISPESQTFALRDVGRRRLDQLEGLADSGVKLKRLVLAIGKAFFEMARNPTERAPEVNSFVIAGKQDQIKKISSLLKEGVGHLAFEVNPRTKNTTQLEVRDDEFRLHRIYSGFFEISYRKKRRTTFQAHDLIEAAEGSPSSAIAGLIGDEHIITDSSDLSEQLAFFTNFFAGDEKGQE